MPRCRRCHIHGRGASKLAFSPGRGAGWTNGGTCEARALYALHGHDRTVTKSAPPPSFSRDHRCGCAGLAAARGLCGADAWRNRAAAGAGGVAIGGADSPAYATGAGMARGCGGRADCACGARRFSRQHRICRTQHLQPRPRHRPPAESAVGRPPLHLAGGHRRGRSRGTGDGTEQRTRCLCAVSLQHHCQCVGRDRPTSWPGRVWGSCFRRAACPKP